MKILHLNTPSAIGILAALFAALTWSMNFIAPLVVGEYSIFDLAACRFIMSGLIGLVILMVNAKSCRSLAIQDWLAAAGLGFIGYVGYFMAVVMAATYAGPVIAPAFLGLVPVILAICGNLRGATPWRLLFVPFGLAAVGLLLVNGESFTVTQRAHSRVLLVGVIASVSAVALWTWFGLANQKSLDRRPTMNAWVWTAMMMIGGSVQTLIAIPLGMHLGVFKSPEVGLHLSTYSVTHLYLPAFTLAAVASIAGAGAWTIASQRLPITLASQLLSMEMVFATCLGLVFHTRWPSLFEAAGITLIVFGVVRAIAVFNRRQPHTNEDGYPHLVTASTK